MRRLLPLDGAYSVQVQGTHTGTRTYDKRRDGTILTSERDAKALIREGLAVPANTAGPTAHLKVGYICPACGRRNYFRRCGGCGGETDG